VAERKPNAIITPVTLLAVAVITVLFAVASLLMVILAVAEYFQVGVFRQLGQHPTAVTVAVAVARAGIWITVSISLLHYRRQLRRRLRGDCLRCGYSLTGNTTGICPECGTVVGVARLRGQFMRWLYLAAATTSLLLLAAGVVLWSRSYSGADSVTIGVPQTPATDCVTWGFVSNRGLVRLGWQNGDLVCSEGFEYRRYPGFAWTGLITRLQRQGFSFDEATNYEQAGRHGDYVTVVVPWWTVIIVTAILPLSWLVLFIRRRRAIKLKPHSSVTLGAGTQATSA
jgi:hypothetical protein